MLARAVPQSDDEGPGSLGTSAAEPAHLGHLKRDATAMADDLGADLDQLPCSSKVGYGSTAVYPLSCGNRQQWVDTGHSAAAATRVQNSTISANRIRAESSSKTREAVLEARAATACSIGSSVNL